MQVPCLLFLRQDLDPLPVRIADEVEPHRGILLVDDAHLAVELMVGLEVIDRKGDVGVPPAIVVGLRASPCSR